MNDLILSICTGGFTVALIPQLILIFKKRNADQISWINVVMTTTLLWIITCVYLNMKLQFAFYAEMLQSILWTLILVAKIKFSRTLEISDLDKPPCAEKTKQFI